MAMVELTRFEDPQEGWIAASALSAAGMPAICHINGYGSFNFTMRQATQGFALWVEREYVDEARVFLAERRVSTPEALAWTRHPKVLTGIPLAALAAIEPTTGWMIASARQRPSLPRIAVTVFTLVFAFGVLVTLATAGR